jgi:large subunit ribosomal protein L25
MKSITIKGSERKGKVATKAYVMLERFLACYTEEINQYIFQKKKHLKDWCILQTHTVVIELGNGKSFNAIMQDIQVHPVSDKILHLDFFKSLTRKRSLSKFLLKSLVSLKVLWLVEIYV